MCGKRLRVKLNQMKQDSKIKNISKRNRKHVDLTKKKFKTD